MTFRRDQRTPTRRQAKQQAKQGSTAGDAVIAESVAASGASAAELRQADPGVAADIFVDDRPITRRELRALRERAEAEGTPMPRVVFRHDVVRPVADASGVVVEEAVPAEEAAPLEASVPVEEAVPVEQAAPMPVEASSSGAVSMVPVADVAGVVEEAFAEVMGKYAPVGEGSVETHEEIVAIAIDRQPAGTVQADETVVEAELVEPEPASEPAAVAEPTVEEPTVAESPEAAPTDPEPVVEQVDAELIEQTADDRSAAESTATDPADEGTVVDAQVLDVPVGHWTTQAELDDAIQLSTAPLSRDVGLTTGAITTHALVLPTLPETSEQLLTPLTDTGEIVVTGIVELPRSLGETGTHASLFDHSDVDALDDEQDREDNSSNAAPVRASRAVSTSSSRRVIEAPRPRGSRVAVVIGVIVVGAIFIITATALVAAFAFNVFE